MTWEHDKGIIIFLLIGLAFCAFCAFMAVRSAKKQKASGETKEQQEEKMEHRNELFGLGVAIFFGVIWLASAVLILVLNQTGNLPSTLTIPRLLALPYELLGIIGGAIAQIVLSSALIVSSVRSIVKARQNRSAKADKANE